MRILSNKFRVLSVGKVSALPSWFMQTHGVRITYLLPHNPVVQTETLYFRAYKEHPRVHLFFSDLPFDLSYTIEHREELNRLERILEKQLYKSKCFIQEKEEEE